MKKNTKKLDSPVTQLVLYILLLIITPFMLVLHYLQPAIGIMSDFSFYIFKIKILLIPMIAFAILIALVIIFRKKLNIFRIISLLFIIFLIFIAQNSTDYYLGSKFYDLQNNWHYIAYAILAYMIYRVYKQKKLTAERIILYSFIIALCISSFDETFQLFMTRRTFDISDIAKDVWGANIGMIILFFVIENGDIYFKKGWKIRQKKTKYYFKNPLSLLFLELIFTYFLLCFSSVLSNMHYWYSAILSTLIAFFIFFFIFHKSQKKIYAIIFLVILSVQGFFFIKYFNKNIVYNTKGLTVYKGIPIPYFDIMIYPNGAFRLVDKKSYFNQRDIRTICKHAENILLVGTNEDKVTGMGFPEEDVMQFIFNPEKNKELQVIILKEPQACKEFNKLKKQGYNVLFIIHTTF